MVYIAYYIDQRRKNTNPIVLMESFENEEDACRTLGELLVKYHDMINRVKNSDDFSVDTAILKKTKDDQEAEQIFRKYYIQDRQLIEEFKWEIETEDHMEGEWVIFGINQN